MSHFNVYGRMRLCIVEAVQKFCNAKPPFPVCALRVRDFYFSMDSFTKQFKKRKFVVNKIAGLHSELSEIFAIISEKIFRGVHYYFFQIPVATSMITPCNQ